MSNVKIVLANKTNKQALEDWEEFLDSIRNSTPVDINETQEQKAKRIKKLEADPEQWFKYYFPKYCFCEPSDFHKKSTRKVLKAKRLYQARRWARGLSKSTRRMFEVLYKKFAQKFRVNALLISKSESNAIRLLAPYRANLEANQRLINDYGEQVKVGKWSEEEFITKDGCSFRAVGAEQNPRGAKLEEMRVNVVIFDDVDDDEVCRNPERLQQRWEWIEQAVIPTVDISKDYFIFFDNNIIAEDSIAVRAAQYADDVETINIRENDKSVWPEKNSEADIDYMLSKVSYESGQKEYFNNPLSQGKTFKEMIYGKCPPLKDLDFVVQYADPATSNKDKPSIKSKAQNSCKANVLVGYSNLKFYVYKAFVDNTTNANFIDWLYAIRDYAMHAKMLYSFIENNTLQDPFYEQVLLPLIFSKGEENKASGGVLGITPDDRDKPDKWFRVEGTLEPLNRLGLLVLNEEEKNNPHMQRLEAQFKSAKSTSKELGAPDAVEGAVFKLKQMVAVAASDGLLMYKRTRNKSKSY
jgi:hypothetical protein